MIKPVLSSAPLLAALLFHPLRAQTGSASNKSVRLRYRKRHRLLLTPPVHLSRGLPLRRMACVSNFTLEQRFRRQCIRLTRKSAK